MEILILTLHTKQALQESKNFKNLHTNQKTREHGHAARGIEYQIIQTQNKKTLS